VCDQKFAFSLVFPFATSRLCDFAFKKHAHFQRKGAKEKTENKTTRTAVSAAIRVFEKTGG